MRITWQAFVIDVILYGLIVLYEMKIEDFRFYFDLMWSRRQRRLFCNIVGAVLVVVDAVGILLTRDFAKGDWEKIIIFHALAVLLCLHVLNSVFALMRWKKAYTAVDIIGFFVSLAAALGYGVIQLFSEDLIKGFFILAILYFLNRRGMRMLDGGWLDSRLEAFDKE